MYFLDRLVLESLPFQISGSIIRPMHKAAGRWTRPLEGFLTTFGIIGSNGGIIPTYDREGQVMEAAKTLGLIDFQEYLAKGLWNDTHDASVIIGRSDGLEFHDGTTRLSQEQRKVGYFTTGHLFDSADPASLGDYRPSPKELERADYFWDLAKSVLDETDRGLAFSAHGRMWTDPTGTRILRARVDQAAVCETPMNPYTSADIPEIAAELAKAAGFGRSGDGRTSTDRKPGIPEDLRVKLLAIIKRRFPNLSDSQAKKVLADLISTQPSPVTDRS